ncbi:MAG TPA: hypothetical protein VIK74_03425, partial [Parasegetibacter sp.]
ELFQIGGYKLLRGFDEESIFASRYGVLTAEYRYLTGPGSFLFGFADAGVSGNHGLFTETSALKVASHLYIGAGVGMALETRAGVFNLSFAAGKRNDLNFDIRQSKIHFGYVNYF